MVSPCVCSITISFKPIHSPRMDLCQSNDSVWKLERPVFFLKGQWQWLCAAPPGFAVCSADSAARFTAWLSGFCERKPPQVGHKRHHIHKVHVNVKKWWKMKKATDSDSAAPDWLKDILVTHFVQNDTMILLKYASLETKPYPPQLSSLTLTCSLSNKKTIWKKKRLWFWHQSGLSPL